VVNGGVQVPVVQLPPPAGQRTPPPAAALPPPARVAPAPAPPQVVARAPEQPAPAAAVVAPPKKPKARSEDAFVAPKDGAVPAAAPPPAAKKARSSSGYVAVVSSHRTTAEALAAVADLQQRHSSVVGGKLVDVQEYDASSTGKGVWYRAVVGPPGSRQAIDDVCGQLKTAGVASCFAAPF
jgi:hypothetical protein